MLRRSFVSALGVLAVLAVLTACRGDSGARTGPDDSIAGLYTLQTGNGNTLPWRFLVFGSDWSEITSGSVRLDSDGTYSIRFDYRLMESGQQSTFSETFGGTYVRSGNAVTFTDSSDGSTAPGVVSGNQISVRDDGIVYVFRRS
jgi:hypothetical protein